MGTEIFHLLDDSLLLPNKIDIIGGNKNPIMKIHAFQNPISKVGISDIFSPLV
jgi:hypothetical protein